MGVLRKSRGVLVFVLAGGVLVFGGQAAALSSTPDVHVPQTNGSVYAIVQDGNTVYVGGNFSQIGGVARNRLAAFDATTGVVDPAWDPDLNGTVSALVVSGGKVYVGGWFTTVNAGATTRNRLAAFNAADGASAATVDPAWDPNMNNPVYTLAVSGGVVYAGGAFTALNGGATARVYLAAFNLADGVSAATVDPAWNPSLNLVGGVNAVAVSGGKVYAGGAFTTVNGGAATRNYLAAFSLADGVSAATVDPAWDPNMSLDVSSLAVSGGKVYVGGSFSAVNGGAVTRNRLAAFNTADGTSPATVDPAWDPDVNSTVAGLAVSGGKVYACGIFTAVNGGASTRNRLAAFNLADGTSPATPDAWDPNANTSVWEVAPSGSGGVLAGGSFTTVGGNPQLRLAGFGTTAFMPQAWLPAAAALLILGAALVAVRVRRAKRSA